NSFSAASSPRRALSQSPCETTLLLDMRVPPGAITVSRFPSLVFVFRLPVRGAFGKEIEEVPDRAEIITRSERRVADPAAFFFPLPLVHGPARQPAVVAPIAHGGGEGGIAMRHHAEAPAARCLEFLLRLRIVGRRDHEGGAILDVRQQAVETVGP